MIKIEKLKNDAEATIDGVSPLFEGQLITHQQLTTLVVTKGTVVFSIDELEVKEVSSGDENYIPEAKVGEATEATDTTVGTQVNVTIEPTVEDNCVPHLQVKVPGKPTSTRANRKP